MPNITTTHAITYTYQNSLISLPYPKLACLKSPSHHSSTYMYLYSPYIAVPFTPYGDQPHQHLCSLIIPHLQEDTFFYLVLIAVAYNINYNGFVCERKRN